jgi:hypothetical protein
VLSPCAATDAHAETRFTSLNQTQLNARRVTIVPNAILCTRNGAFFKVSRCRRTRRFLFRRGNFAPSRNARKRKKGKAMFVSKSMNGALAAMFGAGIFCASVASGQAAMAPMAPHAAPNVQKVDCAVGMRLGPLGGCVLGTDDDHRDKVIEHRSADDRDGCTTKTIKKTDDMGNSETRSKTNC